MAMKKGKIKSLDTLSKSGIIAGEKDSIVIFDTNDLRGVNFLDLAAGDLVLYRDLKIPKQEFRDALRVVRDLEGMTGQESKPKKRGIVISWNNTDRIGVLRGEDSDAVFFSISVADQVTFENDTINPDAEVEYEDQLLNGRRIATSVLVRVSNVSRSAGTSSEALEPPVWNPGKIGFVNTDGGQGQIDPDQSNTNSVVDFVSGVFEGNFALLSKGMAVEFQLKTPLLVVGSPKPPKIHRTATKVRRPAG